MSTRARDETSTLRHRTPGCVVCGATLLRAGTGRRRLYCGPACRQRAYRLRDDQRHWRGADPHEVTRLLAAVLRASTGR